MIITISGTPGVGKTYLSKKLAGLNQKLEYFDLNAYIKEKKLYDSYDKTAKTFDVDVKILKSKIEPLFRTQHSRSMVMDRLIDKTFKTDQLIEAMSKEKLQGVIVDSHLSHYIDSDYCIIVKADLKEMNKRLEARKYPKTKIKDNIESEIFEVCLDEARSMKRRIIVVDN